MSDKQVRGLEGPSQRLVRAYFEQLRQRIDVVQTRLRQIYSWLQGRTPSASMVPPDLERISVSLKLALADVSRLTEELADARGALAEANFGLEAELARRSSDLAALDARLVRSEDRLSLAQLHGGVGSWDWDVLSGYITWSDSYFHLYGLDPRQVTPSYQAWLDSIHPEDRAAAEDALQRCLAARADDFYTEYRIQHPDKGVMWLAGRGRLTYDAAGHPLRMLGFNIDITERKQAQLGLVAMNAELRRAVAAHAEREAQLRHLVHGLPHLVWRADARGRWSWCSPQWCTATGLSEAQSEGEGWRQALHPADRAAALRTWPRHVPAHAVIETEARLLCQPDGVPRRFLGRAAPARGEGGSIVEWLGTFTDIDERRPAATSPANPQPKLFVRPHLVARNI